jgi:hypothetical protein
LESSEAFYDKKIQELQSRLAATESQLSESLREQEKFKSLQQSNEELVTQVKTLTQDLALVQKTMLAFARAHPKLIQPTSGMEVLMFQPLSYEADSDDASSVSSSKSEGMRVKRPTLAKGSDAEVDASTTG